MIDDPPLLTIAAPAKRPKPGDIDAFRDTQTSFIADAMEGRGALDFRIKPVVSARVFVGVALTCESSPGDNLAFCAALAQCGPGDVLVAATSGYTGCALAGDLLLGIAKNRGAAGFVTDGLVRDTADLEALGLPCFAAGISPNSPSRAGPGTVGLPVICGGVAVSSGDLVIGDRDGVVVVPAAKIAAVIESLAQIRVAEAAFLAKVQGGLTEVGFMTGILSSDRVRRVRE
jgi:4-hydroxy-4-methyl-2-oxoglutarate aldolase